MSEINFSLDFECTLSGNSLYASKILTQEKLIGYTIKKSGAGYIISSPFLGLSLLKSNTEKLFNVMSKVGKLDTNKVSTIKISNPLYDDVKFFNELDYKFFTDKYPSLLGSVLTKYVKTICPVNMDIVKLAPNANSYNFFVHKDYDCIPYSKVNAVNNPHFSLRLIGTEFKVNDLDEIIPYLTSLMVNAYKGDKGDLYLKLITRYNNLTDNLYSYRLFKDKYSNIRLGHDLNFNKEYMRQIWVEFLPNLKFLFWFNGDKLLKKKEFDLNWNGNSKRFEVRFLKAEKVYFKETNFMDCRLEGSIIVNSTIVDTEIIDCYLLNCYLFNVKTKSYTYLDDCYWDSATAMDKEVYITKKEMISKSIDFSENSSDKVTNYERVDLKVKK